VFIVKNDGYQKGRSRPPNSRKIWK
jgi:hypothetical protein